MSRDDARRAAALAGIEIADERVPAIVAELSGILRHLDVLRGVDTSDVDPVHGVGTGGMRLRADGGPAYPFARRCDELAPSMRDGFFLVPRLPSHADVAERDG